MDVSISRIHFPVTTLGPGQRLGIWFQGCSIRCSGCISADTWGAGRRHVLVSQLIAEIEPWLYSAEGITISGGEPFDQADALIELLHAIRSRTSVDILVYSGYPLEKLRETLDRADGLIDALISDPYEEHQIQTLALRGSDNQRLSTLTERGAMRFASFERKLGPSDMALDLMVDGDGSVWMAGIPRRGDLIRLRELLQESGHSLQISAHTSRRR
ncbi:MAG TPA: radical SAM protein [Moraxellaceae bacterium]|nr:radical SAM protein [Moraxellaceae bacterium]